MRFDTQLLMKLLYESPLVVEERLAPETVLCTSGNGSFPDLDERDFKW